MNTALFFLRSTMHRVGPNGFQVHELYSIYYSELSFSFYDFFMTTIKFCRILLRVVLFVLMENIQSRIGVYVVFGLVG